MEAPSPRGSGVGEGVGVGVDVGVRVGVAVGVDVADGVGAEADAPGQGEPAGYCAMITTHATRLPSPLEARPAPTHLNGSELELVSAYTPLPG